MGILTVEHITPPTLVKRITEMRSPLHTGDRVLRCRTLPQYLNNMNGEIKALLDQIREAETSRWKVVRMALLEIENLGGYKSLGYANFADFCKQEFNAKNHFYSAQITAASIEILVGVPVCTYSATNLRPLTQWKIKHNSNARNVDAEGNKIYGKEQLNACSLGNAEKVREAWAIAVTLAAVAGLDKPSDKEIYQAIAQLHEISPEKVRAPSARNGAEIHKIRCQKLEEEISALEVKYADSQSRVEELEAIAFKLSEELKNTRQQVKANGVNKQVNSLIRQIDQLQAANNLLSQKLRVVALVR